MSADDLVDEVAKLRAQIASDERYAIADITERDNNAEWADLLAGVIAELLSVEIGEHSNMNNPWKVAYDAARARLRLSSSSCCYSANGEVV